MCNIRIPIGVEVDFAQLLAIHRRHFVEPWTSAVVLCKYVRHDSLIWDTLNGTWLVYNSWNHGPRRTCSVVTCTWLVHVGHVSFTCVCAMTHSHLCDIYVCDMTEFDTTFVTTRHPNECSRDTHIHIHPHPHSYRHTRRHDWLQTSPHHHVIHVCDATHSYVWHDSFICVTSLIDMCDVTTS